MANTASMEKPLPGNLTIAREHWMKACNDITTYLQGIPDPSGLRMLILGPAKGVQGV
jgi:hypothetical protein